jgi:hypothetical protein
MRGALLDLRRATTEEEVRLDAGKSAQVSVPVPPTAHFDRLLPARGAIWWVAHTAQRGAISAVRLAEIRRKSVKIPGTNRASFTERLEEPE